MFFSNGLPHSNIKRVVFWVLPTPFLKYNKISLDSLTLSHIVLFGRRGRNFFEFQSKCCLSLMKTPLFSRSVF